MNAINGYKTIIGIAIGLIVALGTIFGVGPIDVAQLPSWAQTIVAIAAALAAYLGRASLAPTGEAKKVVAVQLDALKNQGEAELTATRAAKP